MRNPLTLTDPLGRRNFVLAAAAPFLAELALKWVLFGPQRSTLGVVWFLFFPTLAGASKAGDAGLLAWFAFEICIAWLLTILALRRAIDADVPAWVAAWMMVPFLRLPLIAYLALRSSVPARLDSAPREHRSGATRSASAAAAALVGLAVTVVSVALGAFVFGSYQYAMFVLTPFFIGVAAGYLVNRNASTSIGYTSWTVFLATLLGAVALIGLAMEGLICIVLASPLALLVAWLGGLFGRAAARAMAWRRANAFAGFVILPFALALDGARHYPLELEMESTVEIAASPQAVWSALVRMSTIAEEPGLVFRLGVGYPVRSEILGDGAGAVRCAVFSTGIAVERVTVWDRNRHLAFQVVREPPSMRELSFHQEVHAPHLHGYFSTHSGSFRLDGIERGHTRLVERTQHSLRYEPSAYWVPFVRWMVKDNHARVLRHIRNEAESATAPHAEEEREPAVTISERSACEAPP